MSMNSTNKEPQLSLYHRMISATTGSFLTSLFLTPMDVVRVRLQQQEMLQEIHKNNCECVTVSTQSTFKKHLFWEENCFSNLNCKDQKPITSTIDAFRKITMNEGITTLWRGLSLTLLMAIPANVIYYSGYETLRDISPLNQNYGTVNALSCGAGARVIAASFVAPIELLRTRLQSIPAGKGVSSSTILRDLFVETRKEIKNFGVKSLFKGLEITLWRDVPFSGIYWASYEYSKKSFFPNLKENNSGDSSTLSHFLQSFIAGSVSGTVAGILTHPFDVGKTRLQISMNERMNGSSLSESELKASRNMFLFLNRIRVNEGFGALFAGITPRIIKIAPSCAIMISTYEVGKRLFL